MPKGAIRPGAWWYGIAAAIAVLGIAGGIIAGIIGLVSAIPELDKKFEPGETITITLDKGEERTLYATAKNEDGGEVRCRTSPGLELKKPDSDVSFTDEGDEWGRFFIVKATRDGSHQIECTSDDADELAIGEEFDTAKFGLGIAAFFVGPCGGILIAAIIIIIVAVKRKSHRAHLTRMQNF